MRVTSQSSDLRLSESKFDFPSSLAVFILTRMELELYPFPSEIELVEHLKNK